MNIEQLLILNQKDLYSYILKQIVGLPHTLLRDKWLVVNVDDTPKPMLCAHLDTVNGGHYNLSKDDIIQKDDIVSLLPTSKARCLGGDDRCGVYIALKLINDIKRGVVPQDKYSFGFFFDEEIGGVGSYDYSTDERFKVEQHTAFIGLDRRNAVIGKPEVASYNYDSEELFTVFDAYQYDVGSFTDCAVLSEACNVACVNLSVGYNHEHTTKEYINQNDMLFTYWQLREVVFSEDVYTYTDTYSKYHTSIEADEIPCELCGVHEKLYKVFDEECYDTLQVCESCATFIHNEYNY